LGAEKEWKSAAYFKQWEHIRNVWLLRIFSSRATPCTPQEWRNILSLGIIPSKSTNHTVTSEAIEKVRNLIGDCLTAAGVSERSLAMPLRGDEELELLRVDPRRGQVLIWELCELNFRWELQALDRRLVKIDGNERLRRQHMLLRCFSIDYDCITSVNESLAQTGLAAPTFTKRFPYIQALSALMHDWPLPKPSSWSSCPNPVVSPIGDKWEKDVVRFYAQTFYDYFGRPAVLPRTLQPVS
jgi:hypothetical protein